MWNDAILSLKVNSDNIVNVIAKAQKMKKEADE